jgi:exosortase/archaeosortase family protein
VPTDIAQAYRHSQAGSFALRGLAWSLGLFGLIRLGWFETHAVLPITQLQASLAAVGFGVPPLPVEASVACSGADAVALCAAAVLAYPAVWWMRLAGAAGGVTLIVALNILRIGTLGHAAGSAFWFQTLHVYVWPAVLMLAIAAYVFTWMRAADARCAPRSVPFGPREIDAPRLRPLPVNFLWWAAALVLVFTAISPWYLESAGVLAVAGFVARAAATILHGLGLQAEASANLLSTSRGAFMVTQECIATPLIPLYLAAVLASVSTWRVRAPALLAAFPLFVGLGIARLLVMALPAALIGSPSFLIHAFYQLLLAAVLVCLAAFWRHGAGPAASGRAFAGMALGTGFAYLAAPLSARVLRFASAGSPFDDPQGALALLPAFQAGLYVALFVAAVAPLRLRPFMIGLTAIGLAQCALVAALVFLIDRGWAPHVRDIRALAIAMPVLMVLAIVAYERPRH